MAGPLNRDTNPFVFMATVPGSSVVPGYFFVSYEYELWNPIGESYSYSVTGPTTFSGIAPNMNGSAVLLSDDLTTGLGPGTTVVWNGNSWMCDGVPCDVNQSTPIYYYQSG